MKNQFGIWKRKPAQEPNWLPSILRTESELNDRKTINIIFAIDLWSFSFFFYWKTKFQLWSEISIKYGSCMIPKYHLDCPKWNRKQ